MKSFLTHRVLAQIPREDFSREKGPVLEPHRRVPGHPLCRPDLLHGSFNSRPSQVYSWNNEQWNTKAAKTWVRKYGFRTGTEHPCLRFPEGERSAAWGLPGTRRTQSGGGGRRGFYTLSLPQGPEAKELWQSFGLFLKSYRSPSPYFHSLSISVTWSPDFMPHAIPQAVLHPGCALAPGQQISGLSLAPIFILSIVTESWLGHATQKKRWPPRWFGLPPLWVPVTLPPLPLTPPSECCDLWWPRHPEPASLKPVSHPVGLVWFKRSFLSVCHVLATLLTTRDVMVNDRGPAHQELKV